MKGRAIFWGGACAVVLGDEHDDLDRLVRHLSGLGCTVGAVGLVPFDREGRVHELMPERGCPEDVMSPAARLPVQPSLIVAGARAGGGPGRVREASQSAAALLRLQHMVPGRTSAGMALRTLVAVARHASVRRGRPGSHDAVARSVADTLMAHGESTGGLVECA